MRRCDRVWFLDSLYTGTTTRKVLAFGDEEREIVQDIATEFEQIVSCISPRLRLSICNVRMHLCTCEC